MQAATQYWMDELVNRSEGTRERYSHYMELFTRFAGSSRARMNSAMTWLAGRVGLNGDVSAHSFRKFFQTRMESAGVSPNWIDQMTGHKLPGVLNHYSLPTDQELSEAYRKSYDSLRVLEPKHIDDEKVEALRQQVKELQEKLDGLTQARQESDKVMDSLFDDPEFRTLLRRKLKGLKT